MRFAECVPILVLLLNSATASQLTRGKTIPFFEMTTSDFVQYGFQLLFKRLGLEPEAYLNTAEIIEYNDYPVEVHQVTTGDGYVLEIYRIAGKNSYDTSEPSGLPRSPVVLWPMIPFPSEVYVVNGRNESLGFILADAGFDVWLASWRGTEFSRKHVTLDPDSTEYWQFCIDEFGKYDVADTIKYVHGVTGQKVVTMSSGFGALSVMLGLISRPEINNMINLNVGMSALATMNSSFSNNIGVVFNLDLSYLLKLADETGVIRCGLKDPSFIKYVSALYGTFYDGNINGNSNGSRIPVYNAHMPTDTSYPLIKQVAHGVITNEVRQCDWGKEENVRRHGTAEPQLYDFKSITSNYLLLRAFGDDKLDSDDLRKRLPDNHDYYMIPDKSWHSTSYVYSINGKAAVYDYLTDYIRKMETGISYRNIEL